MDSEQTSQCSELSKYSHPLLLSHRDLPKEKVLGRLKLFESLPLPGKGGIAFTGGRVSVLKWHPTARGILATAAHKSEQLFHEVLRTYSGPAHIQIWRMSGTSAACLGVIPHNGDCTWDLKWRPGRVKAEPANRWSGTFAAALGDGCILISTFENVTQTSSGYDSLTGKVRVLPCSKTLLRVHKKPFLRRPVRVLEWSLDGTRLLVGSVNGFVEVYEASSDSSIWPKWTIPAQESIVSDMKWLNPSLFCTLGISCVLRLRDIRDPVATIEQNAEGLAGSLSMSMAEPNVAVVGGDTGYLRVVRLRGTDNFNAKHPVRRVYVQGSSFRTMQSISVPSPKGSRTILYTGGCEGIVHEISFPRPLWPDQDQCTISRTRVGQLLRWCVEKCPAKAKEKGDIMHLTLGGSFEDAQDRNKGTSSDREGVDPRNGRSHSGFRKKTKVVGPHGTDKPLFGDSYHQAIVVTRVDVSIQDNMIAVGIDGGIVTWLPLDHESIDSSLAEDMDSEWVTKPSASSKKRMKTKKTRKPNVKTSRPRSSRTQAEVRISEEIATKKEDPSVQEESTPTHVAKATNIKSSRAEKSAIVSRGTTRKRARSSTPTSETLHEGKNLPADKDKKTIGARTRSKASVTHAEE
ncbi:hypothetical protein BWQ96_04209 [Gracilariopsis chorda]|uniref:Uncharacterized protein n=1 Tax=Gracilariopsis chorda TaxID=448386 RepID=A0A2V3IV81_9FLOR|nr:hypothetical protein BWQ96_04209 [Gracilariopsis chorda]|eukprot:PXF46034.1 hypothetical protein BWQ96_04209 [Gracilariopsis chorda]